MPENPFEESTLSSSTPLLSTPGAQDGMEVRYAAAQRFVVPAALAASGVLVSLVLFFVLQPPLNLMVALIVAMLEFSTAGLMWFFFNSALVRADSSGITQSQFGRVKTVKWEEIAEMKILSDALSKNGAATVTLLDSQKKTLMQFNPNIGGQNESEKLMEYISNKWDEK